MEISPDTQFKTEKAYIFDLEHEILKSHEAILQKLPENSHDQQILSENDTQYFTMLTNDILAAIISISTRYLRRSQVMKAVARRVELLFQIFEELRSENYNFPKESLLKIAKLLNQFRLFTIQMMQDNKPVYNEDEKILSMNPRIDYLIKFDEDIKKFFEAFEGNKGQNYTDNAEKSIKILKELGTRITDLIASVSLSGQQIISINKKNITNEEAYAFWIEFSPSQFLRPVEEIQNHLKNYYVKYYKAELKEGIAEYLISFVSDILQIYDPKKLTAKDINLMFELIPFDSDWNTFITYNLYLESEMNHQKKEQQKIKEERALKFQEKLDKITSDETTEEKELISSVEYTRFLVKRAYYSKTNFEELLSIRNLFISQQGELIGFGSDPDGEIKINGIVDWRGEFELKIVSEIDQKSTVVKGILIANAQNRNEVSLLGNSVKGKFELDFELEKWIGYYCFEGKSYDMNAFFRVVGENVSGISIDEIGIATWTGKMDSKEVNMIKQYINQHFVLYDGKVESKLDVHEIRGKWDIEGTGDDFFFSFDHAHED